MSTSPEHKRTALVTGANSGLGKAIVTALAADGLRVGLVARDRGRGEAALADVRAATGNQDLHLFVADLADQESIRALAQDVRARFDRLHLLINNAGTAFPERRLSPQGIERAFAINHLGPFLLTNLLLDLIKASAPARIVNVGTRIDAAIDFDDLNWDKRPYGMMKGYAQSKLGNLHFTFELARRLEGSGVTVNCVFPGVFKSNLGGTDGAQGLFWKLLAKLGGWAIPKPESAAQRVLYLANAPELESVSGQYYANRKTIPAPAQALDAEANRRLWEISERMTGLTQSQTVGDQAAT
ncbi:SDR family oxidoreductase [Rhodopseudomonas palustris]|uniref:PAN2 protein short shain alcohol dehydrogenase n=1 Tax=Rhodopseudomonas palustris (strain ATCC BAA-98 / CGA009) TaxID=258594 RepID=Q6NC86_RHOPA|nr:SDR family oxidoreductase [Rhodopseudomonas palustris]OPF94635.1 short-chain dehydrogenase [Rhodopseudomonas palustris]PPQ44888.1 short-chain dehydrogenase [Rhodopseudomonas palustris]QQM02086.1 3-oxoacyl-[acyl-carrier-protein] reductase [Rhodopseudomonas palustris]RJF63420.1 SDR family oxidoreductase [Rhodopseudomonas palustris]WAB78288.1 SDR family oxidoreductase [Rhodopseudomonas palustris]